MKRPGELAGSSGADTVLDSRLAVGTEDSLQAPFSQDHLVVAWIVQRCRVSQTRAALLAELAFGRRFA